MYYFVPDTYLNSLDTLSLLILRRSLSLPPLSMSKQTREKPCRKIPINLHRYSTLRELPTPEVWPAHTDFVLNTTNGKGKKEDEL